MEDLLEAEDNTPNEDRRDYWTAPLGGYVELPDGTPILPTSNINVVLHRDTGQPGTVENGAFVPSV